MLIFLIDLVLTDPVQLASNPYTGVMHTSELYFLFDGTNSGVSSSHTLSKSPFALPISIFEALGKTLPLAHSISQKIDNFVPFNSTEKPLSKAALSYWTSFIQTHDPSIYRASLSPSWPMINSNTSTYHNTTMNSTSSAAQRIVIQENLNSTTSTSTFVESVDAAYIDRCLFWIGVGNQTRV